VAGALVPCAPVLRWVFLLAFVAACGDNASPCDYLERDDGGNVDTAEMTGVTVADHPGNVCGSVDIGHANGTTLDVDTFRLSTAGGEQLVEIAGGDGYDLLTALEVRIFDSAVNPTLLAEGALDPRLAGHGAFLADLPAGAVDVVVSATAPGELSAAVPYRVQLSPSPSERCPAVTGRADYVETHDGAGDTGNDVLSVDYAMDPWYAATAGGSPEATGLSISAGPAYRLTGNSAATAHADDYLDRDTFALTTGDTTNELAIRLGWTGQGADLDYHVFEAASMTPVGSGELSSTTPPELEVFPVKPSTAYWLWIGRFQEAMPGATVPYDATICGGSFTEGAW
jgi:hypothetical protein